MASATGAKTNGTMAEETARDQSPFRRPGQRNPPVVPPRPELVGRLSVTSMNFAIPTNQDAQMHVHEEHGKESWRYRVLVFLHSTKVQFTLMSLLVLDVVILCTELFLLASFPNCSTITRDAISCCPVLDAMDHSARFLAEDTGGHSEEFCEDGSEASLDYEAGCDVHKYEGVHLTEEILFALTITILAIFFIELNLTMVALRPQVFFRQMFYLLDYFIVTVSIALELTFHLVDQDTLQSLIGLLVVFRLWRFVRIGHGLISVTHEYAHRRFALLLSYTEELEELLKENDLELPENDSILEIKAKSAEILTELRKEHYQHKHRHREGEDEDASDEDANGDT